MAHTRARLFRLLTSWPSCSFSILYTFERRATMCDILRSSCILLLMMDGSSLTICRYRRCKLMLLLDVDVDVWCFQVGWLSLSMTFLMDSGIVVGPLCWCWWWYRYLQAGQSLMICCQWWGYGWDNALGVGLVTVNAWCDSTWSIQSCCNLFLFLEALVLLSCLRIWLAS